MRTFIITTIALALFIFHLTAFKPVDDVKKLTDHAKKEITKVIIEGYFNGAFNKQDTKAMKASFHPDFAIFYAEGENLGRYEISKWISGIEKKKQSPGYDPSKNKMDCKIVSLDVTGNAATAKVECWKSSKKIYTDYLSIIKFKNGWKIAAKIYFEHKH